MLRLRELVAYAMDLSSFFCPVPDPLSEEISGHLLVRDMLHVNLAGADPLLKNAVAAKEMQGSRGRTSAGGDSLVREVIGCD